MGVTKYAYLGIINPDLAHISTETKFAHKDIYAHGRYLAQYEAQEMVDQCHSGKLAGKSNTSSLLFHTFSLVLIAFHHQSG